MKQVDLSKLYQQDSHTTSDIPQIVISKKRPTSKLLLIPVVLFVLICIITGGLGLYGYQIYQDFLPEKAVLMADMVNVQAAVQEQNLLKIKEASNATSADLTRIRSKVEKYKILGSLPIARDYYQDVLNGLSAGESGLKAANLVVEAIEPYADLLGLGAAGSSGKTTMDRVTFLVTTLDKIRPKLDSISTELQNVKTAINKIDPTRYPEDIQGIKVQETLQTAILAIDQASSLVTDAKPLLEVAPDLLGVNKPKMYFILFQNDAELRPTGGFMTAYGILKVDKGKISPIFSDDIYALDAVSTKRLPVPEAVKKYHKLPDGKTMTQLFLRDSNISPDFAVSMKQFMEYYQAIPGSYKVDGVIAVDTKLLADLLRVIGRIGVPGWGNFSADIDKRCDCPQVVYQLEEIADRPVTGLKEGRKAVIGPLMNSILQNAFYSPKEKVTQLVDVSLTAITEKHVLMYLFDEKAQSAVEAFNFAGRIREFDGDYQFLVDTNFGGAKSNLFIKEKIDTKIELGSDGNLVKTVAITYNNPFKASDCNLLTGGLCLNGQYRNWARLYVPKGSEIIEVTGSEVPVISYEESGKTVFEAFYGNKYPLRPESTSKLTFKYKLPFGNPTPYKLLIQKQPGIASYAFTVDYLGQKQEFELRADKEMRW